MSDNKIKTNVRPAEPIAEAVDEIGKIEKIDEIGGHDEAAEFLCDDAGKEQLKKVFDMKIPANNGAEKILELYQKISASGLPHSEKDPLLKKLLSEWKRIVEHISETALNAQPELSVGYILSQIEKIQQDNEHIIRALNDLEKIVINDGVVDIANQARCEAIGDAVKCRETTNQKLIEFYSKLYDDVKQAPGDFGRSSLIENVSSIERCDAGLMNSETSAAVKSALFDMLQPKADKEAAPKTASQVRSSPFADPAP